MQTFTPYRLRGIEFRNRLAVAPMCQYSSEDGFASDWHLVHLGSRTVGGAGLIITEANAVEARGRISPQDLGIWKDEHIEMLARINRFIKAEGAVPGTQLAHAGRKASTRRPWEQPAGTVPASEGGWTAVGPATVPFSPNYPVPVALSTGEVGVIVRAFADAAKRSLAAGFEVIELHFAHGYLAHQFYSSLTNTRTDKYGASFENRIRMPLEIVSAVREVWPEHLPLLARISATEYTEGGWDVEQSVELSKAMHARGVDLIDCSSGGNIVDAKVPFFPLYQVPFAEQIRREAKMPTGAVGLITTAAECESILAEGKADLVLLAREWLRDAYFPLHAAHELDANITWPVQYERAKPPKPARV